MQRFYSVILLATTLGIACSAERAVSVAVDPARERIGVSGTEIKIGSSAALSEHASFLGTQLTAGSRAYFNEVNARGGIHDRKIRFIVYDDAYEPDRTLGNTRRLIEQDQVFALFDYVGTPTSRGIVREVNDNQIPVLGLFTGAEFLRTPLQPFVLNVRASYFDEVEHIVDHWVEGGLTRIAVFMQDDAFGGAVLSGTELALARHNIEIVAVGRFQRGEDPEEEEVARMVAANPDAIVMVGTSGPLARFVQMARDAGLSETPLHTVSFIGSAAFARDLLEKGPNYTTNVFVTQVVPAPTSETHSVSREFVEVFAKHYPDEEPNYVALEGYINAKILVEALERTGKDLTRSGFIQSVEGMSDYDAGTGLPVRISPYYHGFFQRVYLSELRDGSFQIIGEESE